MAKKDCEDMGAHLVVINSEEEMVREPMMGNTCIWELLFKLQTAHVCHGGMAFW